LNISTWETAAHSWHAVSPPLLLEDIGEDVGSVAASSPEDENKAKKLRMSDTPGSVVVTGSASSTLTASQILSSMIKVRTLSFVR
jgi:hypothetical protein